MGDPLGSPYSLAVGMISEPKTDHPVKFQHLRTVGWCSPQMFGVSDSAYRAPCLNTSFVRYLSDIDQTWPDITLGRVVPTYESMTARLSLADFEEDLYCDVPIHKEVMAVFLDKIGTILLSTHVTPISECQFEDTASGYPWKGLKNDVFRGYGEIIRRIIFTDRDVVFRVTPKSEYMNKVDILSNKVRLFYPAPIDYLLEQKILFDNQNKLFKIRGFHFGSCYGMIPYSGGFAKIFRHHSRFAYHYSGDSRRQDVTSSLMRIIYRGVRRMFLDLKSSEAICGINITDEVYSKHIDHLLNCKILMWNGQVIAKKCINPSGQNNTTVDNTMIYMIMLLEVLHNVLDLRCFGTLYYWSIFGDDWILSTNVEISVERFHDIWKSHGMALKLLESSPDLRRHPFLGFVPKDLVDYLMIPNDIPRMLSSARILNTGMSKMQEIEKMLCLLKILSNTEYAQIIHEYIIKQVLQYKLMLRVPTLDSLRYAEIGFESWIK